MLIDPYQFRPVRIEAIVRQAKNAVAVRLSAPEGYDFELGQHTVIRVTLPDGSRLVRQYSFSDTADTSEIWLTIVQEPDGQVSGWFNQVANVGDVVEISKPFAGPLMQKNLRGDICMIAGGSGIAPLIGYVRTLRKLSLSFTLLYSTRTDEECYTGELAPLSNERIIVRRTDTSPRLTEAEVTSLLSANTTALLCGSRPFVLAMRSYCEQIVPPENIHSEAFSL
jgi:ferredoxin-NADP reductase